MGLTAQRRRERLRQVTAVASPAPPKTDAERLAERGEELGRLRIENAALRKRVAELESRSQRPPEPQQAQAQRPLPMQNQRRRG